MEIQAAIVLVLVFFLMLAMSVPVSFSIISASLLTIIMFLTPGFGMFVSARRLSAASTALHFWPCLLRAGRTAYEQRRHSKTAD